MREHATTDYISVVCAYTCAVTLCRTAANTHVDHEVVQDACLAFCIIGTVLLVCDIGAMLPPIFAAIDDGGGHSSGEQRREQRKQFTTADAIAGMVVVLGEDIPQLAVGKSNSGHAVDDL